MLYMIIPLFKANIAGSQSFKNQFAQATKVNERPAYGIIATKHQTSLDFEKQTQAIKANDKIELIKDTNSLANYGLVKNVESIKVKLVQDTPYNKSIPTILSYPPYSL